MGNSFPDRWGAVMAEEAEVSETAPTLRRGHAPRARSKPLGFAITLVVALAIFVGVGLLFHSETYTSPAGYPGGHTGRRATPSTGLPPARHLGLQHLSGLHRHGQRAADPPEREPGWPAYGPTNQFQVPAHALVTVTVRQYDSGGTLNNPLFATVRGTVGNVARVNGKLVTLHRPQQRGPHLHGAGHARGPIPAFFLNVPFPARPGRQPDGQRPVRVGDVQLRVRAPRGPTPGTASSLRDAARQLRRPDVGLRVHVGVHPCRLRSRRWKSTCASRATPSPELKPFFSRAGGKIFIIWLADDRRGGADRHLRPAPSPAHHAVDPGDEGVADHRALHHPGRSGRRLRLRRGCYSLLGWRPGGTRTSRPRTGRRCGVTPP